MYIYIYISGVFRILNTGLWLLVRLILLTSHFILASYTVYWNTYDLSKAKNSITTFVKFNMRIIAPCMIHFTEL